MQMDEGGELKCIVFGATVSRCHPGLVISSHTYLLPELCKMTVELGKSFREVDPDFCFTSVHIVVDATAPWHVDADSTPPGLVCSIGGSDGGRTLVRRTSGETSALDTKNKLVLMNVVEDRCTENFTLTASEHRYTFVFLSRRDRGGDGATTDM